MTSKRSAFVALLLCSVAGQVAAASHGAIGMAYFAAAAFGLAGLQYGFGINRAWWANSEHGIGPPAATAHPAIAARNAETIGLGYAWGGLSLLAVYLFSGVRWQHGWQYGFGMVVIAVLVLALANAIRNGQWAPTRFRVLGWVSAAHGLVAFLGVFWLISSGKAQSLKGDWAANVVFLTGGLLIVGITAMALKTGRRLQAGEPQPPG